MDTFASVYVVPCYTSLMVLCVRVRAPLCLSAAERRERDGYKCRGKEQFKQSKKKRVTLEVIVLKLCMRSDLRAPARL